MVPHLAGPPGQPPYSLGLGPGPHLVDRARPRPRSCSAALGLAAGLAALARGWAPDPRRLLLAGCLAAVVLAFLPPSGSADHLNYAAYGRIAALGLDPYAHHPRRPARRPGRRRGGGVAGHAERLRPGGDGGAGRWRAWSAATRCGSPSSRWQLVNAAAFVAVAVLLYRSPAPARPGPRRPAVGGQPAGALPPRRRDARGHPRGRLRGRGPRRQGARRVAGGPGAPARRGGRAARSRRRREGHRRARRARPRLGAAAVAARCRGRGRRGRRRPGRVRGARPGGGRRPAGSGHRGRPGGRRAGGRTGRGSPVRRVARRPARGRGGRGGGRCRGLLPARRAVRARPGLPRQPRWCRSPPRGRW